MSGVVERVDGRTLRAVDGQRLLATAKRVSGSDRWAVSLAAGGHRFVDGEMVLRVFLAGLADARSDQPNGQPNTPSGGTG